MLNTKVMPGRKPIFATLVTDIYNFLRDYLFRAILEPESHAARRAKRMKKENKRKKK